jgi:hypothetical protein
MAAGHEGGDRAASGTITVRVAFSPAPRVVDQLELQVPIGATAIDAVRASSLPGRHPEVAGWVDAPRASALTLAIWGRVQPESTVLRPLDRIELLRPLTVDPKEARRLRYRAQRPPRKLATRADEPTNGTPTR